MTVPHQMKKLVRRRTHVDLTKVSEDAYVKEPVKRTVWVNFWADGTGYPYNSRAEADDACRSDRIACKMIEFEEGEGL